MTTLFPDFTIDDMAPTHGYMTPELQKWEDRQVFEELTEYYVDYYAACFDVADVCDTYNKHVVLCAPDQAIAPAADLQDCYRHLQLLTAACKRSQSKAVQAALAEIENDQMEYQRADNRFCVPA